MSKKHVQQRVFHHVLIRKTERSIELYRTNVNGLPWYHYNGHLINGRHMVIDDHALNGHLNFTLAEQRELYEQLLQYARTLWTTFNPRPHGRTTPTFDFMYGDEQGSILFTEESGIRYKAPKQQKKLRGLCLFKGGKRDSEAFLYAFELYLLKRENRFYTSREAVRYLAYRDMRERAKRQTKKE